MAPPIGRSRSRRWAPPAPSSTEPKAGYPKAVDGKLIRSFQWSGDTGEILKWVGPPDSTEQGFGLPDVVNATQATSDAVFDASIDEETVMTLAGHWSLSPEAIQGTPSAGDPLVGTLP
jgi:hypothetical protein